MSHPAIEVSGLAKRYVIEHEARHDNLRDTLHHAARKLWRRARWGTGFDTEEFWALRDVSFTVQPGEVVGVIGRNGAGKSTLLKVLSRITEPTAGRVTLRGRIASLLEVGTGFHPDLTGRENIFLNGAILGMRSTEIRRKFDEIVAFAEVERFIDTPVKRYSSGMYVRLAFAVAAHLEPEILIVDEVLAVGDAQFQKKCLGKMREVSTQHGRTVLFVSHQMSAIAQLCSRAILLSAGRVAHIGPTQEVLQTMMASPPLTHRPSDALDRPRITDIAVSQTALESGNLQISVSFESPHVLTRPHVGIVLTTQFGALVAGTNTNADPCRNSHPASSGLLRLHLAHPPLLPGQYRINVWFGDGDGSTEHREGAVEFYFPGLRTRPPEFRTETVGPLDMAFDWEQLPLIR